MIEGKFNDAQIAVLKESFAIAKNTIENVYKSRMDDCDADKTHCGNDTHWQMMNDGISDFQQVTECICSNELEKVSGEKWREVMFVLEVIEHNDCRGEDAAALKKGLTLLVGMFRNRFPGQQWNPYEYRWTTIGDPGERGISPMLMAIAEL